jgi:LysM repeat protein
MTIRRLAVFIVINIVVSISVTLLVLNFWDAGRTANRPVSTLVPTLLAPVITSVPTPVVATPTTAAMLSHTYVVQAGDTPLSIARLLGVRLEDLLAANNLHEGDILSIGQSLVAPSAASLAATVEATVPVTPRSIATSTPAPLPIDTFITIKEIVGTGSLLNEAVVLTNLSSQVELSGWSLSDGEGHKFVFPDLVMLPNSEVTVHTVAGANSASDLYWGQTAARWGGSGTIAYLRDPSGKLAASYRVP